MAKRILEVTGYRLSFRPSISFSCARRFGNRGLGDVRDVFFHSCRRFKRLQTWFEARSSYLQCQSPREPDGEYRAAATGSISSLTQDASQPPYATNQPMAGPSMSSSLMQLECSSVWMGDSWLDGLMDFTVLDQSSNQGSGTADWDGMNHTYWN